MDLDNENYENIDYFRGIQNIYEYEFYELNNETRNIIGDIPLCYNISNENLRNKFEWCDSVIYIPTKKTYECFGCYYGFYLNQSNKTCLRNTSLNEEDPETINNCSIAENSVIYSCQSCYYYKETLVSFETGIKECIRDVSLENCLEATANSSYDNILYNCTSCDFNYLPYYSKFYGRQICQNIFEKITKNKNISLDIFDKKNSTKVDNKGNCPEKYFTPDGKNCYACDNEKVGMPGCNGKCSFSLKRNNSILCEADCKEGYLESSEGVCETCDNINKGCSECHYESNSLIYYGKRARTFQCDYCEPVYVLSETGKCIKCSDIMYKCDKCQKDEKTGGYKCTSCPKNFIYKDVNQDFGYCEECFVNEAIIKEKCVKCYDSSNGGVEKCKYCLTKDDGTEIVCNECFDDYILLSDNNTCLYRENNTELNQFDSCLELTLENGKYICSRCKPQYSLLKEGSEVKCAYIPTLFDYYFQPHYYDHYYYEIFKENYQDFDDYVKNDYLYRQSIYLPCKETINLGTTDNPLYSCSKCYNIFDNEEYDYYYYNFYAYYEYQYYNFYYHNYDYNTEYDNNFNGYIPTKIIDNRNNISYCIKQNHELENCTEATYTISKG